LSRAELLVILSTAKGLMTHPDAGQLIPFVAEITPSIDQMAQGTTSPTAVGGMTTKITAAKIATKSGCAVFIGSGENPQHLMGIVNGQAEGTFFAPSGLELNERKKWLAFFPEPKGSLQIDEGACEAILLNGGSLLARGLTEVKGEFDKAEVVEIVNPGGKTIARGISRFGKDELLLIRGKTNSEVLDAFPGKNRPEIVHRDHLAPLQTNLD
jgi:glutamate 5-kinase